jgi:hypothetical protein
MPPAANTFTMTTIHSMGDRVYQVALHSNNKAARKIEEVVDQLPSSPNSFFNHCIFKDEY